MKPSRLHPSGPRHRHRRLASSPARVFLAAFLGFLIALSLLLAVTELVAASEWSYEYSLSHPGVSEAAGLDRTQIRDVLMHVLGYARGTRPDLQLTLPDGHPQAGEPAFSQREIDHMVDVRRLFAQGRALRSMALALLALAAGWSWWRVFVARRRDMGLLRPVAPVFLRLWGGAMGWAAGWGVALFAVLALALTAGFSAAFDWFHLVLFDNDLWQLPEDSMLITLLPTEQFQRLAVLSAAGFAGGLALLAVAGWMLRRRAASRDWMPG